MMLTGCQVSTEPHTVQKLSPRDAPTMTRAAWDGAHALYSVSGDKKPVKTQVQSVHLRKGEPVGFRTRENGVVAVAGDVEIPVSSGTFEWVLKADPGQTDPGATTLLVVVLVVAAAGIVAAVIAINVQHSLNHFGDGIAVPPL